MVGGPAAGPAGAGPAAPAGHDRAGVGQRTGLAARLWLGQRAAVPAVDDHRRAAAGLRRRGRHRGRPGRPDVRPEPTPQGVRDAVLAMVADPGPITDKTWRTEPQHDPSPPLRAFIDLRDVFCDGPTGTAVPARRCHRDHNERWPDGPTAAWNLKARGERTHQLKHRGWTRSACRTAAPCGSAPLGRSW